MGACARDNMHELKCTVLLKYALYNVQICDIIILVINMAGEAYAN